MILMLDNYDSFTFNIVQYLEELGANVKVFRNDKVTCKELEKLMPEKIVISPGPCTPKEAGVSKEVIKQFSGRVPILGVCLGHQCIGEVFGGKIINAKKLMHGKISNIYHEGSLLFKNIPSPFEAVRYHSLAIERSTLPDILSIDAQTDDKEIMAVTHKELPVYGVQFHPESVLTEHGKALLKNFLDI
ncbi:MAG: aminodeoxychorismate/anthranilate synthase component II [Candidatus Aureabacteria bacterium]|nr:aminodeoxychorismate/anthranilate synthase component II [Candidatus Auribacterota bacterium]